MFLTVVVLPKVTKYRYFLRHIELQFYTIRSIRVAYIKRTILGDHRYWGNCCKRRMCNTAHRKKKVIGNRNNLSCLKFLHFLSWNFINLYIKSDKVFYLASIYKNVKMDEIRQFPFYWFLKPKPVALRFSIHKCKWSFILSPSNTLVQKNFSTFLF